MPTRCNRLAYLEETWENTPGFTLLLFNLWTKVKSVFLTFLPHTGMSFSFPRKFPVNTQGALSQLENYTSLQQKMGLLNVLVLNDIQLSPAWLKLNTVQFWL